VELRPALCNANNDTELDGDIFRIAHGYHFYRRVALCDALEDSHDDQHDVADRQRHIHDDGHTHHHNLADEHGDPDCDGVRDGLWDADEYPDAFAVAMVRRAAANCRHAVWHVWYLYGEHFSSDVGRRGGGIDCAGF